MNGANPLRFACVALALAAQSACLFDDVEGIPCIADDECPSDSFCDFGSKTCDLSAGAPPHVLLQNITDPGGISSLDPFVTPNDTSVVVLHLKNDGGAAAEGLRLELSPLSCLRASFGDVPAALPAGDVADVELTVTPALSCSVPLIVDWFAYYEGRSSRGTFNLVARERDDGDEGE